MPSLSRRLSAVFAVAFSALLFFTAPARARDGGGPRPDGKTRYVLVFRHGTTADQKKRACARLGLKEVEDFAYLDIVVAVEADASQPEGVDPNEGGEDSVEGVEQDFYINWIKNIDPSSFDGAFSAAGSLVRSARSTLSARSPRAPSGATTAPSAGVPWGVARVGAPNVWNRRNPASMGAGVKVAVVDTGIDCGHPDLRCDASLGYNALDETADPFDDNGHGTHVAGTIAGRGLDAGDGTLVFGVAPMATLIPVKVLDQDGGGALSDVVRGINWAAQSGADIISMSLGSPKGSATLQKAVQAAYARGVTVVAAAGNSGPGDGTVGYPGRYAEAIAVAASDQNDDIAKFSSRGPEVAFTAPGVDILSTWPGGGYKTLSGTSMAAPHITGLSALAVAAGARGEDAVRQALSVSAARLCHQDVCPPQTAQGGGMPDAGKLARSAGGGQFASASVTSSGGL